VHGVTNDVHAYRPRIEGLFAKAGEFAPQLGAYAQALRAAGERVFGIYVHFTMGAGVG
jgi:hypothetical protein